MAERFRDLLDSDDLALGDLLYTAGHRRAHLSHRLAAVGNDRTELSAVLDDFLSEESKDRAVTGTQPYQGKRAPVFVYTGMGPQWWGMGQELMEGEPIYRAVVEEADAIFQGIAGFSILDEMQRDEATSRITETRFAQPANLMVQIGLTAVLRAGGVQPGAIIGHSVGEVASAYASGVLDLEQALTVSYHRSRLQQTAADTGGMLAVALGLDDVQPLLEGVEHSVSIAAINGPSMITLAGDETTLERLSRRLDAEDVFNRILQVEVPYHSPMMDPLKGELQTALAGLTPRAPSTRLYSTVTGGEVGEQGLYEGAYWAENIREPVYFAKAIAALIEAGYNSFIEVGPHPVLSAALRDCVKLAGIEARTVETLRRGEREVARVHRAIAS